MSAIESLIFVNIALWVGFGVYFFFLAKKQQETDKRLNSLMADTSFGK